MNRAHDETSESLLHAAHHLLASEGPDALTVRRIAAEAGMSTMNVYSRFGGKDGVIDELYVYGFRKLFERLDRVPETDDTLSDLLAVAVAYRAFATEYPMYYEVMFRGNDPSDESSQEALGGLATLVARVERGVQRGNLTLPPGLGALETTAWLWGTCHGLVSLELDGVGEEALTWADIFEPSLRVALSGLQRVGVESAIVG